MVKRSTTLASRLVFAVTLAAGPGARLAIAQTPVKASIAPGAMPAWEKGILQVAAESYYNAIECGKQGGDPAPQPNYAEAQRTRITVGVTLVRGSKNVLTDLVLKRGGTAVMPRARGLSTHRFTFDFPAFAPTAAVAIALVGRDRTIACTIDVATLTRMRQERSGRAGGVGWAGRGCPVSARSQR